MRWRLYNFLMNFHPKEYKLLQDGALMSSALFYAYCVIAANAQIWMS